MIKLDAVKIANTPNILVRNQRATEYSKSVARKSFPLKKFATNLLVSGAFFLATLGFTYLVANEEETYVISAEYVGNDIFEGLNGRTYVSDSSDGSVVGAIYTITLTTDDVIVSID